MAWGRLDDKMAFHPKVVAAGNECVGARDRMIAYCCDHGTNGFLPYQIACAIACKSHVVRALIRHEMLDVFEPGSDTRIDPTKAAEMRLSAKLRYYVHDFHEYNPTAEESAATRDEVSQKRSEAGRRGAAARWNKRDGLPSDLPMVNASDLPSGDEWQNANGKNGPDPDPLPRDQDHDLMGNEAAAGWLTLNQVKQLGFSKKWPAVYGEQEQKLSKLCPAPREAVEAALQTTLSQAAKPGWGYFTSTLDTMLNRQAPAAKPKQEAPGEYVPPYYRPENNWSKNKKPEGTT